MHAILDSLITELSTVYKRKDTTLSTNDEVALKTPTQKYAQLKRVFKKLESTKAIVEDELRLELAKCDEKELARLRSLSKKLQAGKSSYRRNFHGTRAPNLSANAQNVVSASATRLRVYASAYYLAIATAR